MFFLFISCSPITEVTTSSGDKIYLYKISDGNYHINIQTKPKNNASGKQKTKNDTLIK